MHRKGLLLLLGLSAPLWGSTDRPIQSVVANAPPAIATGSDLLFVVGGDNRPTAKGAPLPRVLGTIFSEIGLIRPDFVLWTGDTVYGYCDSRPELEAEYQAFLTVAAPGGVPLFNAPGNHEIHAGQTCPPAPTELCGPVCSEQLFRSRFGNLYGSFDYAGAHFIALDTEVPGPEDAISGPQLDWLKRDLESNKGARATFVFSHTEFYSSPRIDPPSAQSHPAVATRAKLHDLSRRYPVKAVFSGHEHLYWREPAEQHDGIDYFVAGGAGAPLYAPPDRGGVSHYVVVRLSGSSVTYDVIEPGRLYVEPAVESAPEGLQASFWIVNSNDPEKPLPLRGIEVEIPASLGACSGLTALAEIRRRDGAVPVEIALDCAADLPAHHVRLKAPAVPGGASVRLTIRRKQ